MSSLCCWALELHFVQGRGNRAVPTDHKPGVPCTGSSPPLSRWYMGSAVPHSTPTLQGMDPRVGVSLHPSEMPLTCVELDLLQQQ